MSESPTKSIPISDSPNHISPEKSASVDDYEILEKLSQIELLPELFALLQRLESGEIKGQDFDKHAGSIRLKLSTIRMHLQEVDGICESVDERRQKIEVLGDCNVRRASFLEGFKERVLADLEEKKF